MFLGALLDLGVPEEIFQGVITALGLEDVHLEITRVAKQGIAACHVVVHHPEQHVHRHLQDIVEIIEQGSLEPKVATRAIAVFERLAEAEAKAHGTTVDDVHFHEVGAVDAIVDIVCTVAGFHHLGAEEIRSSPVHLGTGFIDVAHGTMPIPVPATVNLLSGVPTYSKGIPNELVTPTGAALLTELASAYGPMSSGRLIKVGYGAGTRDLPIPNLLRLVLFEPIPEGKTLWDMDEIAVMECSIDDHNPELLPPLAQSLLDNGALDVYVQNAIMKGGRAGVVLTVLSPLELQDALAKLIFKETTTLGIRLERKKRYTLPREMISVEVASENIQVKIGKLGEDVVTVAPEYRDCYQVAQTVKLPVREVYDRAKTAARAALQLGSAAV
ncbi:MAG: nickel pincer cofactor biosynthesis protein LarC [Firmicutes bacterium]|nr:nickel pincer cofactor biosynthesis protein LarC [Bacillota bacterium]